MDHWTQHPHTRAGSKPGGRLRQVLKRLLTQNASPLRLGVSVGVGVLIGCSPLYGLQSLLCLLLAWILRLNTPAMLLAAQISTPPLTPFLLFAEVQVGSLLLLGQWAPLGPAALSGKGALDVATAFFSAWIVGSVAVGLGLAGVLGLVTYAVALKVRRRRGHQDEGLPVMPEEATWDEAVLEEAQSRAAKRYAKAQPRDKWYARMKYRLDPAYRMAARALAPVAQTPGARIVDLGCGRGMLGVLFAEAGGRAEILGLESDESSLLVARAAAEGTSTLRFEKADVATAPVPPCEAAAILDVLHYFAPSMQDAILDRVVEALLPGGRLVIREADAARPMRLLAFFERLGLRVGWHRGPSRFHYRPAAAIAARLRELGLHVTMQHAGGIFHKANVFFCADKPGKE